MLHKLALPLLLRQVDKQFRDIVLDPRQDDFYKQHLYANYGDVGSSVKTMVTQFTEKSTAHKQVRGRRVLLALLTLFLRCCC